jgi:5-methylthioadenosine/S-adenosylhomocysteine deaminase
LITLGGEQQVFAPGVVDVEGDTVVWSGPAGDAPASADATVEHVRGALIPGLLNVHCHTPMVLLRGAGEGLPVERWLKQVMWPREARLTPDDVRAGMTLGAAELLRNGITTSVEMYFHGQAVAEAAEATGIRCVVTAPIIDDPQLSRFGTWQEQLAAMVEMRDAWSGSPLIEVGIGPHAAYSTSEECLRSVADAAVAHDMLVHIHVAEQQDEDAGIRERTGLSIPKYLDDIGVLRARTLAAHCIWLSDDDIDLLAERSVAVAHCPVSNMKHASGIAPVRELREAGVTVAVATDGPASHQRMDLFEELRTAIRLERVRCSDATTPSTSEAFATITTNAARAIGRTDLGHLRAGAKADMVAVCLDDPALGPVVPGESDLLTRLVWSGSPSMVSDVWVGGCRVVRDREVSRVDISAALKDVTERSIRLAGGVRS